MTESRKPRGVFRRLAKAAFTRRVSGTAGKGKGKVPRGGEAGRKSTAKASPSRLSPDRLQYASRGNQGTLALVIGLDFGTSATKIVCRAPYLLGGQVWTTAFGAFAHETLSVIAPTALHISNDGCCSLLSNTGKQPTPDGTVARDIKLSLFDTPSCRAGESSPQALGYSAEQVAAAYLGLLLRYTREWLLLEHESVLSAHRRIDWSLNMGVPSPSINDNPENKRFRRVGKAAWMLSMLEGAITLANAERELKDVEEHPEYWRGDPPGSQCQFDIVPEICAAAVGYALSKGRQNGLHIMMDFGASTVDACSFLLRKTEDEEDGYSLLTADVQQYGTIKVHQERVRTARESYMVFMKELVDQHDPLCPLSTELNEYLPPKEIIVDNVQRHENSNEKGIVVGCAYMLIGMLSDLRTTRAPNDPSLNDRLRVLVTGGGCEYDVYRTSLEYAGKEADRFGVENGIRVIELPLPESIGSTRQERLRLAVAWGLSYPSHEIGSITPMDQIPDIPRRSPPPPLDEGFIGKEYT